MSLLRAGTFQGSYQALLDDPDLDAVYIPLPNHLHCDWAVAAAKAGKHILCEKPLGLSPAEVDRMRTVANSAGVLLVEAFQFLTHPLVSILRQQLRRPELGAIRLVRGHFSFSLANLSNIRLRYLRGGGSLWDIGCYPVCFMLSVLGLVPQQVQSFAIRDARGVDLAFSGQIVFQGGVLGQFTSSYLVPYRVAAEVICEGGGIAADDIWRAGIDVGSPPLRVETREGVLELPVPPDDPFLTQIRTFEGLLGAKRPFPVSLGQSRLLAATLCALHEASRKGQLVAVRS